jgi:endonuclease/exonuclease/phosphatase family metal-dependent hydrolase
MLTYFSKVLLFLLFICMIIYIYLISNYFHIYGQISITRITNESKLNSEHYNRASQPRVDLLKLNNSNPISKIEYCFINNNLGNKECLKNRINNISKINSKREDDKNINTLNRNSDRNNDLIFESFNFSIITWNIWFDSFNFNLRVKEILKILEYYHPDIICLQEVTILFKNFLYLNSFIKMNYYISDNQINPYGVLILSHKRLKNQIQGFYEMKFISRMGRSLLIIHLKNGNEDILIGTAHFESLYENWNYRVSQLKASFQVLDLFEYSFLVGDFNFDPEFNFSEEENIKKEKYQDAWLKWVNLKSIYERGETFPQEHDIPPTRLDRVYYSKNKNISLGNFEMIGKKEIQVESLNENNLIRTPSDHKRLYLEFILNANQQAEN